MSAYKKRRLPQYLDKVPVYNVEHGVSNSSFFNIRNLSEYFMLGKNSFFIGNSPKLEMNSNILVEAVDSIGNVIYTEYPGYKEDASELASVYVYDDTASGLCTLTLLGIAKDVPPEWKNKINTKWTAKIYVDPTRVNKDIIRFISAPSSSISLAAKIFLTGSVTHHVVTGSYIRSDGNYTWRNLDNMFTPEMEGNYLRTTTIQPYPLANYYGYTWDSNFTTKILKVISPREIQVANLFSVRAYDTDFYPPAEIFSTSWSVSYDKTIYTDTNISASIVTVDTTNLETYTGKVDKVYVYKKSLNKPEDYTLHTVANLTEENMLSIDNPYSIVPLEIGTFTPPIIQYAWFSFRQRFDDGNPADNVTIAFPLVGTSVQEGAIIMISSSLGNFSESYTATQFPLSGNFQFSGGAAYTAESSAYSFADTVNSCSMYFTASYLGIIQAEEGFFRPAVSFGLSDEYTGRFFHWWLTCSPSIFFNADLYNTVVTGEFLHLNQRFPSPLDNIPKTSSGYFSNAVQISESYYSTHYYGEEYGKTDVNPRYRYKAFRSNISMSMYANTEYVHEAYIAGFGELEIRVIGTAVNPDNISSPALGKLIGHITSSTTINYGLQQNTFIPENSGTVVVEYVVKKGVWDIGRAAVRQNTAMGYSANRMLFRFPLLALSTAESWLFKLVFANPENSTNSTYVISEPVPIAGITVTSGGAKGGVNVPRGPLGALIYSDGADWRTVMPVVSPAGWLVNEQGLLLVNFLY